MMQIGQISNYYFLFILANVMALFVAVIIYATFADSAKKPIEVNTHEGCETCHDHKTEKDQ